MHRYLKGAFSHLLIST